MTEPKEITKLREELTELLKPFFRNQDVFGGAYVADKVMQVLAANNCGVILGDYPKTNFVVMRNCSFIPIEDTKSKR